MIGLYTERFTFSNPKRGSLFGPFKSIEIPFIYNRFIFFVNRFKKNDDPLITIDISLIREIKV